MSANITDLRSLSTKDRFPLRPAALQAAVVGSAGDLGVGKPVRKNPCFSVKGEQATIPAVTVLLGSGSPSAVLRAVRSVVVDSVDGVVGRRACSHVSQEVLKRTLPSSADLDSSGTIVFERFDLWVPTAVQHRLPGSVFRGDGALVFPTRLSVSPPAISRHLSPKATTALGETPFQRVGWDVFFHSTNASAMPHASIVSSGALSKYGPASKCHSRGQHGAYFTGLFPSKQYCFSC